MSSDRRTVAVPRAGVLRPVLMTGGRSGVAADVCVTAVERWDGARSDGACGHVARVHEQPRFAEIRSDPPGRCSFCGCGGFTAPPRELWGR